MKSIVKASAVALALSAVQAQAACPTTGLLTNQDIKSAFGGAGKYHCAIRTVGPSTEKWNESLGAVGSDNNAENGTLTDYKRGADPMDPTSTVGTWAIANGSITYTYGASSYTYVVTGPGPYSLCNTATSETFSVSVSTSPTANATSCP